MTTKNIGAGRIGDVVAKVLQECQNGLLSSTYLVPLKGDVADVLDTVGDVLGGYVGSIAGDLVVRETGFDLVAAPFATISVELIEETLVVAGHRLENGKTTSARGGAGPAWTGDEMAAAAENLLKGRASADVKRRLDGESVLLATIAADVLNDLGIPAVPAFVRRQPVPEMTDPTLHDGVAGSFTEVWEARISVDDYAMFEATHPAYGAQMAVAFRLARKHLTVAPQRVLDVGSGPGLPTLMLAELFPDAEIDAVEPSAAAFPHLVRNVIGKNIRPHNVGVAEYQTRELYPLTVSVGTSHHLDTRVFLRAMAANTQPGGLVIIADEMLSEFSTAEERTRNLIDHHMAYVDEALAHIDADLLPIAERKRLHAFRTADRHAPGAMHALLEMVREDRTDYYGPDNGPWERVRFAVLELEALVAGIDYDVERKTYPSNFLKLAEAEGLRLVEHERVHATVGGTELDGGTHVFAFLRP